MVSMNGEYPPPGDKTPLWFDLSYSRVRSIGVGAAQGPPSVVNDEDQGSDFHRTRGRTSGTTYTGRRDLDIQIDT